MKRYYVYIRHTTDIPRFEEVAGKVATRRTGRRAALGSTSWSTFLPMTSDSWSPWRPSLSSRRSSMCSPKPIEPYTTGLVGRKGLPISPPRVLTGDGWNDLIVDISFVVLYISLVEVAHMEVSDDSPIK